MGRLGIGYCPIADLNIRVLLTESPPIFKIVLEVGSVDGRDQRNILLWRFRITLFYCSEDSQHLQRFI
jgi:hypothetical protein